MARQYAQARSGRGLLPSGGSGGASLFVSGIHYRFPKAKFDRAAKSYDGKVGQFGSNVARDLTQFGKEFAPVRFEPGGNIDGYGPGRLRDSIKTKTRRTDNGDVGWQTRVGAPYGAFVHDGIGQPAQPFMTQAAEQVRKKYGLRN